MKTFYGLQWYLAFLHHVGPVGVWLPVVAGGGIVVLMKRGKTSRQAAAIHRRECLAPLGVIVLGVALVCLPGWRDLDALLNRADMALLGCFFQLRNADSPGARAHPSLTPSSTSRSVILWRGGICRTGEPGDGSDNAVLLRK